MRRIFLYTILLLILPTAIHSQALRTNDANSQAGKNTGFGSGEIFNPFSKDTTKTEKVVAPKEIHQWHIDELLGDVHGG